MEGFVELVVNDGATGLAAEAGVRVNGTEVVTRRCFDGILVKGERVRGLLDSPLRRAAGVPEVEFAIVQQCCSSADVER